MGSVGQLVGNTDRIAAQKGVGWMAAVRTVVTAAALGVTAAYSPILGQKVSENRVPGSTQPWPQPPPGIRRGVHPDIR